MGGRSVTRAYTFADQQRMSTGLVRRASIAQVLCAEIPGATGVRIAKERDDRAGTDYWVDRRNGRALSVDAKVRATDWATRGKDDLALETWSVVERKVPGWTVNADKQTDYILWLWSDTGRWCLVPFPMLCAVTKARLRLWAKAYETAMQYTPDGGYHSECVFVPRKVVWREIYLRYGGA